MGHTSFQFDRRTLLKSGVASAGALALGPSFFMRAFAHGPVQVGKSPYGPLQPFDSNGIALPRGFRSREIARGGTVVPGGGVPYTYHFATDGQATFPTLGGDGRPDGGWILVANSEVPVPGAGGASAVEFGRNGRHRAGLPDPRRHPGELRGRPHAVGHLAFVRGARCGAGLGVRPNRGEHCRRPSGDGRLQPRGGMR